MGPCSAGEGVDEEPRHQKEGRSGGFQVEDKFFLASDWETHSSRTGQIVDREMRLWEAKCRTDDYCEQHTSHVIFSRVSQHTFLMSH